MSIRLIILILLFMPIVPPDSEPAPDPIPPLVQVVPAPVLAPALHHSNLSIWPLPADCLSLKPFTVNPDGSPNAYHAREHPAWDIDCWEDAPVYAIADGEMWIEGHPGNLSVWVGDEYLVVLYGHVKSVAASGWVKAGQVIGFLGTHAGPHLHLEIRINGISVDPSGLMSGNWFVRPFTPLNLDAYRWGD